MQINANANSKKHKGKIKQPMHDVSALERAITVCGGKRSTLARRLNVSSQSIELWLHEKNAISAERAMRIEYVTKGEVTRQELRPDLYEPMMEYYDEVDQG